MNNIWIYGCSFSEPFGLYTNGYTMENGCRTFDVKYFGNHLANKLNMNLKSRSMPGLGWNYHTQKIDEDILKWNKDDIIIISPSYFSRITINEFEQPHDFEKLAQQLKPLSWIYKDIETRWANKIKTLQFFGYNVYTWIIEKQATNEVVHNLIPVSNEYIDLYTFMHQNKKYWLGTTHSHLPYIEKTDWHLNPEGHEYISEQMYNFISNKIRIL